MTMELPVLPGEQLEGVKKSEAGSVRPLNLWE
jgi:hypothetical protein